MLLDLFGGTTRPKRRLPTAGELAHDAARGLFRGTFRLIGHVIFLAITIVIIIMASKYHVEQEAEADEVRAAEKTLQPARPDPFRSRPSRTDGWGDNSIDRAE